MKKERQKKNIRILMIVIAILFCCLIGYVMLRFVSEKEFFQAWMNKHKLLGRLTYIVMVVLQVIIALIPGEPLEIAGGYAFGTIEGTLLYMAAATIGGMLVFLFVRKHGEGTLEMFFSKKDIKGLSFLKDSHKRNILLTVLFILPGTPKDLLCYFAGLTDIKTKHWFIICSLGRIPSVITSTLGGNALETENYWSAVIAFLCAFLISLIGVLIYKRIHKKHNS